MIDGMHGASVYVSDQEMALAWYVEALGMEVRADAPFGNGLRWLEVAPIGAQPVLLLIHGYGGWAPEKVGGDTGIVLTAENVPATFQDLSDRGVLFTMEPQELPWGWNAVFADPDGNTFVLAQSRS